MSGRNAVDAACGSQLDRTIGEVMGQWVEGSPRASKDQAADPSLAEGSAIYFEDDDGAAGLARCIGPGVLRVTRYNSAGSRLITTAAWERVEECPELESALDYSSWAGETTGQLRQGVEFIVAPASGTHETVESLDNAVDLVADWLEGRAPEYQVERRGRVIVIRLPVGYQEFLDENWPWDGQEALSWELATEMPYTDE